jgi:hypothetical protein
VTPQPHEEWEELAAGHALDALDPEEEARFTAHLETCDACRRSVREFAAAAADLGALVDDDLTAPDWPRLRSRLSAAESEPPAEESADRVAPERSTREPGARTPAAVIPLPARREHRRRRVLAAAAAAAVVLVAGVGTWEATRGAGTAGPAATIAACQREAGCRVVHLRAGNSAVGAVLVAGDRASVVATALPATGPDRMYVLWQVPRSGTPIAVADFRSAGRETASVKLPASFGDTAAFAVSREPAGPLPAHPSDVVAAGSVSA